MENILVNNIPKQFKTPIYIRNAQKAYRQRQKDADPEAYKIKNREYIKKYRENKKVNIENPEI
jgi:hypothetical protein